MEASLSLRARIARPELLFVPAVFDAMSALMAERAGFLAAYVGGATLGYLRAATEAALTPHDFVQTGIDIRSASRLPLVMDGGVGWGDPMHVRRTIRLAEAGGYDAIELEDQVAPKRAHHHVGVEHLVPIEEMVAKIAEAVRARRNPDLLIIARTNAVRRAMDDALRRCDAYAGAGADMLFPIADKPEDRRILGARAPLPLAQMVFPGESFTRMNLSPDDLVQLNYRMLIDGITPFTRQFEALDAAYREMRGVPAEAAATYAIMERANDLVGLPDLLEIELRTTER